MSVSDISVQHWPFTPAEVLAAARLARPMAAPAGHQATARLLLWQVHLLWRRRIIDYLLLHAVRPHARRRRPPEGAPD
jgi:hypothetical protein